MSEQLRSIWSKKKKKSLFVQVFQQDFSSFVVLGSLEFGGDGAERLLHLGCHRSLTAVQEAAERNKQTSQKTQENQNLTDQNQAGRTGKTKAGSVERTEPAVC